MTDDAVDDRSGRRAVAGARRRAPTFLSLLLTIALASPRGDAFPSMIPASSASWSRRSPSALASVPTPLDTLTSGLASVVRLPAGTTVRDDRTTPTTEGTVRLATLYDAENDARCRVVREAVSELDLVVERVVPCGRNSANDPSPEDDLPRLVVVEEEGGGGAETETTLRGEEEIVAWLEERFASASEPVPLWRSRVASLLRAGRGDSVSPAAIVGAASRADYRPLVLYSYEGNQFCRLVREVLTELDLPYELRSAGKGSPRRAELAELTGGSTQCPYLVDPNAGARMSESADIVAHLYRTYARWTPPNEALAAVSKYLMRPLLAPVFSRLAPLQAGEDYDAAAVERGIREEISDSDAPVVVYTYSLSPFCTEATDLLRRLDVPFTEIDMGLEWIPGLLKDAPKRAVLGTMTGRTSLPHVFVNGESIGGLFDGTPGLVPSLEDGSFWTRAGIPERVPTVASVDDVGGD